MVKLNRFIKGKPIKTSDDILDPKEIDQIMDGEFNPVKDVPEEPEIKKTYSFDRARLEFLRMQIGPVKNFFQTLDNVLVSISERLGVFEEELLKLKLKEQLRGQYIEWMVKQDKFATIDQFIVHLKETEEQSENKKL